MATLHIDIDNKKSQQVVLAVVEALGLHYRIVDNKEGADVKLSKKEEEVYNRLKDSISEIKQHQAGKLQLQTIDEFLAEIS